MNSESLQKAYNEDANKHPLFVESDLMSPPSLIRQMSGANGGIQNNLIFGENGIVMGFLPYAPNVSKILNDWIINVDTEGVINDEEIANGFEIIRVFLMNNRFSSYTMIDEDMSKTAVRHVLWHLSISLDKNHDRLRTLLKAYSPARFGYEYEFE
jgi:hypothetical protein